MGAVRWVFSDCAAVARAKEQHLSMCEKRPCIRTALQTSDLPNSESENRLARRLRRGLHSRVRQKKNSWPAPNLLSLTQPGERDSVVTDSA